MEFRKVCNYVEEIDGRYYVDNFGKIYREITINSNARYIVENNGKKYSYGRVYKKTLGEMKQNGEKYKRIEVGDLYLTILKDGTILREMFPYNAKMSEGYNRQQVKLQLVKKGQEKTFNLHSIIARVFIGKKKDGYEIHHIDQNPLNNSVDNLIYLPKEYHYEIHNEKTTLSRKLEIIRTFIDYNVSDL